MGRNSQEREELRGSGACAARTVQSAATSAAHEVELTVLGAFRADRSPEASDNSALLQRMHARPRITPGRCGKVHARAQGAQRLDERGVFDENGQPAAAVRRKSPEPCLIELTSSDSCV